MPPWEYLWAAMVWAFYVLCVGGAIIVVFAFVMGLARGMRTWFQPKRKRWTQSNLTSMAETVAIMRYKDQPNADWEVDAFVEGAEYAYDELTHK